MTSVKRLLTLGIPAMMQRQLRGLTESPFKLGLARRLGLALHVFPELEIESAYLLDNSFGMLICETNSNDSLTLYQAGLPKFREL